MARVRHQSQAFLGLRSSRLNAARASSHAQTIALDSFLNVEVRLKFGCCGSWVEVPRKLREEDAPAAVQLAALLTMTSASDRIPLRSVPVAN